MGSKNQERKKMKPGEYRCKIIEKILEKEVQVLQEDQAVLVNSGPTSLFDCVIFKWQH